MPPSDGLMRRSRERWLQSKMSWRTLAHGSIYDYYSMSRSGSSAGK